MFYNGADVGPAAVSEIGQALGLLCSNDEKEVGIFGITVGATVKNVVVYSDEGNVIEENFFTVCRAVKEFAKDQPTLYTFK